MGINISINGVNSNGDISILNNSKVSGKNDVNVKIKDSKFEGNTEMFNDMEIKDANLDVQISDSVFGKNSKVFDEKIKTDNISKTASTIKSLQVVEVPEKKSFLRKLLDRILGKTVSQSQSTSIHKTQSTSHQEFTDKISNNGEFRNEKYSTVSIDETQLKNQKQEERDR